MFCFFVNKKRFLTGGTYITKRPFNTFNGIDHKYQNQSSVHQHHFAVFAFHIGNIQQFLSAHCAGPCCLQIFIANTLYDHCKVMLFKGLFCLYNVQGLHFNVITINPLTAKDELSCLENLTFLWTWILRWAPRSFATHAYLCNTLIFNSAFQLRICRIYCT